MRALLHTEFAALLARADVSQAAFARISGYTPRQVNNWARGRAAAPLWAIALAAVLPDISPEAIQIRLEEIQFAWHETLGVPPNADAGAIRHAWVRLAHAHHPDKAVPRNRWPASMPPMNGPADPNHQAQPRAQPPCPAGEPRSLNSRRDRPKRGRLHRNRPDRAAMY